VKITGFVLGLVGAFGGWVVAFGAWGVGYCGGLTPDSPAAGTLRSDLCRGTSGDLMSGVVVAAWLLAAAAPLLGAYYGLRKGAVWPVAAGTIIGAAPIATIAILAATLPQG
jgi:hypothetical protein